MPRKKNELTKNPEGRPTKYEEVTVSQLEEVLRSGGSISQACNYAGIVRETYYDWLNNKPEFSDRMTKARAFLSVTAKHNIRKAIEKDEDLQTSKWYIEKTEFEKPQTQVNIAGQEMQVEFIVKDDES